MDTWCREQCNLPSKMIQYLRFSGYGVYFSVLVHHSTPTCTETVLKFAASPSHTRVGGSIDFRLNILLILISDQSIKSHLQQRASCRDRGQSPTHPVITRTNMIWFWTEPECQGLVFMPTNSSWEVDDLLGSVEIMLNSGQVTACSGFLGGM